MLGAIIELIGDIVGSAGKAISAIQNIAEIFDKD